MLVRCVNHPSEAYSHSVDPIGYPDTAAVCGRSGCEKPGKILLKDTEWAAYGSGQRVFGANNNFTKVRAK